MSHQGSNLNNVVYLNKKSGRHNMAERIENRQTKMLTISIRQILIFTLSIIIMLIAGFQLFRSHQIASRLDQDYSRLKHAEEVAMRENIQLQQEYQLMQNPDYLLELARRDYLYSEPGEIVFDLDEK